ncbi:hypothetical protein A4A49_29567 [Nicotiana attenuata]|uniref:Transmembrane protein n=1 Tax=Nicotiana attenuata TaxID=49451 RepID=A0A314L4F0_NICAT|nr:hypothetical protein A4A49_29567 [Nicotiana attenuata]
MGFRGSVAIVVIFLAMVLAVANAQYGGGNYADSSPSKNIGSTNSSPAFLLGFVAFIISFFVIRKSI